MTTEDEGKAEHINRRVYVRHGSYAWIPGVVVDGPENGGGGADNATSVRISLPDDWDDHTAEAAASKKARGFASVRSPRNAASSPAPSRKVQDGAVWTVDLSEYPGGELPLQNVDDVGNLMGKSDMADLPHLHEAAILYNLKDRNKRGVPYTRVGDIVVAVNPYKWIDGLYSKERQYKYAEYLVWNAQAEDFSNRQDILTGYFDKIENDPHVYETSSHAYRGLIVDGKDQAILVSGESGAGKTETVKILMTHLARLEGTRNASAETDSMDQLVGVVKQVLDSNPLFEAFGNATTVSNGNSSRFGRFTKLHFKPNELDKATILGTEVAVQNLMGSTFRTYLLEKSRVVSHDAGERTYHLFYQLLAAPEEDRVDIWDGIKDADCDSFRYVGIPETDTIDGRTDAESWFETKAALYEFGFRGEVLRSLMRAVCTVLQLGNVSFELDPAKDDGTLLVDPVELVKLSEVMGVKQEVVQEALTTRLVNTAGEEFVVKLTPQAAKDGCDALAKEIYGLVFQVLVLTINESTSPKALKKKGIKNKMGSVSILDMFGFECFAVNRFEQLCINYANETIQNKYVSDTFLAIREAYENEGIDVYDFSKVDNSDVLSLIQSRTGLLMVLNEECVRPKGSDESFVYKIKMIHKDHKRLVYDRLQSPTEFAVRHFAGTVTYDATKAVERNTDQLPKNLSDCAGQSSNKVIRYGFKMLAAERAKEAANFKKKRMAATIGSKFKSQLTLLMNDIKDSRTRYIRCIKPNNHQAPQLTDHDLTMRQLASAGLVTAITMSRETFPNQLPYEVTWDRFRVLLPEGVAPEGNSEEKAKELLAELLKGREKVVGGSVIAPYACGRTKVFFRSGSLELLQSQRQELYSAKATIVQRWARAFIAKRKYFEMLVASIIIQAIMRRAIARLHYAKKQHALVTIQCFGRWVLAYYEVRALRELKAATVIQSCWRAQSPRKVLRQARDAAAVIQRFARNAKKHMDMQDSMATVVAEAQMDHKMKALQKRLEESSSQDAEKLMKESAKMIEYLSRQLYSQRGRVSYLKTELTKTREKDGILTVHAGSVDAALAANKLEVQKLRRTSVNLTKQLNEYKSDKKGAREALKEMQDIYITEMHEQESRYEQMETSMREEIEELKEDIEFMSKEHAKEVAHLKNEALSAKSEHREEVTQLRGELQKMEESHEEDMEKMLIALEAAQEEDKEETQVRELNQCIETMISTHESQIEEWRSVVCENCQAPLFPGKEKSGAGSASRAVAEKFAKDHNTADTENREDGTKEAT